MQEALYSIVAMLPGLMLGVLFLPWRDTAARNTSTLEYWVCSACFWPYMLLFGAWLLLQAYRDAWSDYLCRRRAGQ